MEIRQILYKVILITMMIIICTSGLCYAKPAPPNLPEDEPTDEPTADSSEFDIDTSLFDPTSSLTGAGKANEIISGLLGVFTVLGAITTVVSIAIIGFNTILGSANEKAEHNQKLVGVIVGAIVLMCGSIIAKALIGVAETL